MSMGSINSFWVENPNHENQRHESHQLGTRIPPAKFTMVKHAKQMHVSFNGFIGVQIN